MTSTAKYNNNRFFLHSFDFERVISVEIRRESHVIECRKGDVCEFDEMCVRYSKTLLLSKHYMLSNDRYFSFFGSLKLDPRHDRPCGCVLRSLYDTVCLSLVLFRYLSHRFSFLSHLCAFDLFQFDQSLITTQFSARLFWSLLFTRHTQTFTHVHCLNVLYQMIREIMS